MMVLSRGWYLVLAIAAALGFYALSLAVGQFNRTLESSMREELSSDVQVVSWAMQLDARRRLDAFLVTSSDDGVRKALKAAAAKDANLAAVRVEAKKALTKANERIPDELRPDIVFVVDREGKLVGHVGYTPADTAPDFELGGYPAVFDALHGYLRDDTWQLGTNFYRVSARPVEDEVGQAPLGAVVGLREVDDRFAQELAKKTRASVLFFEGERELSHASHADVPLGELFEVAVKEASTLPADAFNEAGRTEFQPLTEDERHTSGAVFVRMPGEAGVTGLSYAVLRRQSNHNGPMDFITHANAADKASVKLLPLALIVSIGALIGWLLTFAEHSRPLSLLRQQAEKLRKGEQDTFALAKLPAAYRPVGADVNGGIERVVERNGGQVGKKPADLQAILGPVPAQPSMSAFSLPTGGGPVSAPPSTAQVPPAPASAAPKPAGGFAPPAPKPAGGFAPPAPKPAGGFAPPAPKLAPPAPKLVPSSSSQLDGLEHSETTRVVSVSPEVMAAAAATEDDPAWDAVFEDYVALKTQCNEPVEGLTLEKFKATLRKNRTALLQKDGVKRVSFSVYVKDQKATLKATPHKDLA